jgi:acyl dehydratase
VGTELGVSDWVAVTQEMINQFADVTGDHQFIHVDADLARQTPFGTTIAHGFLTMSLLPRFGYQVMPHPEGTKMGVNYGLNRLRFLAPVKSGKRVRGRFVLKALDEPRPGQILSTYEVTVEIEGEDKPALIAEWLGLTFL